MPSYEQGFRDGWRAAHIEFNQMQAGRGSHFGPPAYPEESSIMQLYEGEGPYKPRKRKPRKRRKSSKQKLLDDMTNKKWKSYKKGSGKKTWVQIRAQVSRSQAYKKKARRL